MTGEALLRLDVLPAGCGVEAQVVNMEDGHARARFQVTDADGNVSRWSGWFLFGEGETVALTWTVFDFG